MSWIVSEVEVAKEYEVVELARISTVESIRFLDLETGGGVGVSALSEFDGHKDNSFCKVWSEIFVEL